MTAAAKASRLTRTTMASIAHLLRASRQVGFSDGPLPRSVHDGECQILVVVTEDVWAKKSNENTDTFRHETVPLELKKDLQQTSEHGEEDDPGSTRHCDQREGRLHQRVRA